MVNIILVIAGIILMCKGICDKIKRIKSRVKGNHNDGISKDLSTFNILIGLSYILVGLGLLLLFLSQEYGFKTTSSDAIIEGSLFIGILTWMGTGIRYVNVMFY